MFAVRSSGATGVVVKGPDDKSSVAFRYVRSDQNKSDEADMFVASRSKVTRDASSRFCFVLCRMDDKGEVKCIKFSIGNKILAVQRTLKSVVSSGAAYSLGSV